MRKLYWIVPYCAIPIALALMPVTTAIAANASPDSEFVAHEGGGGRGGDRGGDRGNFNRGNENRDFNRGNVNRNTQDLNRDTRNINQDTRNLNNAIDNSGGGGDGIIYAPDDGDGTYYNNGYPNNYALPPPANDVQPLLPGDLDTGPP